MKFVNNVRKAFEYVSPYFTLSYGNLSRLAALTVTLVAPAVEAIGMNYSSKVFFGNEDEEEEYGDSDMLSDFQQRFMYFMISYGLFSVSFSMRCALDKYLAESLKKSIKIDNTRKLLDSNNFLSGEKYVDKDNKIVSLQKITLGSRVDIFVDSFVSSFISETGDVISLTLSTVYLARCANLPMLSGAVIFSGFAGCVAFKTDQKLAEYFNEEEEVSNILSSRSAYIENRASEINLIGANNYEQEYVLGYLNQRVKKLPILASMDFSSTFLSMMSMNLGLCFFDLIFPTSYLAKDSIKNVKYLNSLVSSMVMYVQRFADVYYKKYPQLEANMQKLLVFNKLYDEWELEYKSNMSVEYKQEEFIVQNLTITFGGDNKLLDGTDFVFEAGKIYRLLGESGSGKSTLLKAIRGCWPYAKGMLKYPCEYEDICYITPDICIPPNMNLVNIILYPLSSNSSKRLHTKLKLEKCIGGLLEQLDLQKHLPDLIKEGKDWNNTLSSGEKQKIAIISALIKSPKILIMDEPMSNLKFDVSTKILALLKDNLVKQGSIIIYTSHKRSNQLDDLFVRIDDENQDLLQEENTLVGDIEIDSEYT